MKKTVLIFVFILFSIGGVFALRFFLGGDEDTWICQKGEWVKHGNPAVQKPETICE